MKNRVTKIVVSALAFALMSFAGHAADSVPDNTWLIGKWEMSYDSSNSPKDWLEFTADGKSVAIAPDGRRIPGRYTLKELQIEIVYSFDGKIIPMSLRYTESKDRLFAYSPKTKTSSQYKKVSSEIAK